MVFLVAAGQVTPRATAWIYDNFKIREQKPVPNQSASAEIVELGSFQSNSFVLLPFCGIGMFSKNVQISNYNE